MKFNFNWKPKFSKLFNKKKDIHENIEDSIQYSNFNIDVEQKITNDVNMSMNVNGDLLNLTNSEVKAKVKAEVKFTKKF